MTAPRESALPNHTARTIRRHQSGLVHVATDELAVEEPLEIRVEGRGVAVTMRTPGNDDELVAGFLLTEGVINRREEISAITPLKKKRGSGTEPNIVDVKLRHPEAIDFARLTRHVFTASSCGLCGKTTVASVLGRVTAFEPGQGPVVAMATLSQLPATLAAGQPLFKLTGGLHAAALFRADGSLIVTREDVGRHNAVDKVIGHLLWTGAADPHELILMVSGRVAFEIVQKAMTARIACVAAISAPTSLAVDLARAAGLTLVGFLRDNRLNIYAGADRIHDGTK